MGFGGAMGSSTTLSVPQQTINTDLQSGGASSLNLWKVSTWIFSTYNLQVKTPLPYVNHSFAVCVDFIVATQIVRNAFTTWTSLKSNSKFFKIYYLKSNFNLLGWGHPLAEDWAYCSVWAKWERELAVPL
jgi:hypothetical protein